MLQSGEDLLQQIRGGEPATAAPNVVLVPTKAAPKALLMLIVPAKSRPLSKPGPVSPEGKGKGKNKDKSEGKHKDNGKDSVKRSFCCSR